MKEKSQYFFIPLIFFKSDFVFYKKCGIILVEKINFLSMKKILLGFGLLSFVLSTTAQTGHEIKINFKKAWGYSTKNLETNFAKIFSFRLLALY